MRSDLAADVRQAQEERGKLTREKVKQLEEVYSQLSKDFELSTVAFGLISEYLVDTYNMTYLQAADMIHRFPDVFDDLLK